MERKFKQLDEKGANNPDILIALTLLRHEVASNKVIFDEYEIDDFGVNSYMPFMTYLQKRHYEQVRRYLLVHTTPVAGGQWDVAGNGVCQPE